MRARNIKPGFFKNDRLAELNPFTRILFAGLWCIADRAGRLEDRPKRIKAEVLPYDDWDVDAALSTLDGEFIKRYSVDGNQFIQILHFSDHQNPHKNEKESEIPPYQHSTSTVQEPKKHSTNPADSLIPDSLIPDSLIDDSNTPLTPQKTGGESEEKRFVPPSVEEVSEYCESRQNGIDPQEFVAFYASKGWMVGKNKMKDWRAAIWTWEKKRARENPKPVQEKPEDYSRYLDAIRAQQ